MLWRTAAVCQGAADSAQCGCMVQHEATTGLYVSLSGFGIVQCTWAASGDMTNPGFLQSHCILLNLACLIHSVEKREYALGSSCSILQALPVPLAKVVLPPAAAWPPIATAWVQQSLAACLHTVCCVQEVSLTVRLAFDMSSSMSLGGCISLLKLLVCCSPTVIPVRFSLWRIDVDSVN